MDERPRVAVEVDRLARVECHVLARIDFQEEVFQGAHADDAGYFGALFFGNVFQLAHFGADFGGVSDHLGHEVVGVDNGSLAALHFSFGKLDHSVGEVDEVFAPFESETVEQERQNLEVIVLFVADDVDHLVDGVVLIAQLGGADILGHVDRGAVGAEQQLVVETFGC